MQYEMKGHILSSISVVEKPSGLVCELMAIWHCKLKIYVML